MSKAKTNRNSSANWRTLASALLLPLALAASLPACAQDWGYEGDFAQSGGDNFKRKHAPSQSSPTRDEYYTPQHREVDEMGSIMDGLSERLNRQSPETAPNSSKRSSEPSEEPDDSDIPSFLKDSPVRPGRERQPQPQMPKEETQELSAPAQGVLMTGPEVTSSDPQWQSIESWLNILALVAPVHERGKLPQGPDFARNLTSEQRKRFSATLKQLLSGHEKVSFHSVDKFWPALSKQLVDEDHLANYRLLFRALLSLRAGEKNISDAERMMFLEALGPKRIAEAGPPPLMEDAVLAYTDMACFLYEQHHAGKTVDADDNREIFAMVVRDKFKNAPSDRDRVAMNAFPLSWAKFRILYTDADATEKKMLATKIASESGTKGLNIRNHMLETVLSAPVWKHLVLGQNSQEKGTAHGAGDSM